jgi:hypothetical protein
MVTDDGKVNSPPGELARFLGCLFGPDDLVIVRPVESWTEGDKKRSRVLYRQTIHCRAAALPTPPVWGRLLETAERERANLFFGVCPRFGGSQQFDLAWQIRTVRVLWLDIDHCTVEEALKRCEAARLPRPSVIVASGNGVHLYWLLAEPYQVDDVGPPPPALKEFLDQGPGKKKSVRQYVIDPEAGGKVYDLPEVSAKGQHVQSIIAGIAARVGGDHTHDLARILRLPGTLNRKDQRNGKEPVPCTLVECDPGRRYPLADFERFAEAAPVQPDAGEGFTVKLPSGRKLTMRRRDTLANLLNVCAVANDRSDADFHACCWALEEGVDKEAVWAEAKDVGKFAERGRPYFDLTWKKAEAKVRVKVHQEACRKAGKEPSANGVHTDEDGGAPAGQPDGSGERPIIVITPEEHEVNDQAAAALARDPTVFQRAGVGLVHVVRDPRQLVKNLITRPPNTPRIVLLAPALVRDRLSKVAVFVARVEGKEGEREVRRPPPAFCVSATAARGQYDGIPVLEGVVDAPVLRPDGSILDQPGYDPKTGLLYEPVGDLKPVPKSPDLALAHRARDVLLDLISDFPFAEPADVYRATWLASLLSLLARPAVRGPVPLFLIDSNVRGSGKGLLADTVALIATGRTMPVMSNPNDDDECRKRVTAIALAGDPIILIDNIASSLGNAALDAALTSTVWKDRILGRSEVAEMPLRCVWVATGNNVVLLADTARRVAHIRIESKDENPEERQGFKYPDLRAHVRGNRGKLLSAGLTILRGYCLAGRPDMKLKPWGSFEDWSGLVRSAVVWCGIPDPGESRKELRKQSDQEAGALQALLAGVEALDPTAEGLMVSEIIDKMNQPDHKDRPEVKALRDAIVMICPSRGKDFPSPQSIGMKLKHLQGRVVGGKYLYRDTEKHTGVWSVRGN